MMSLDEMITYLRGEGRTIAAHAEAGAQEAINVMGAYRFMADCPGDPGGQMLLGVAIEEYQQWKREFTQWKEDKNGSTST